MTERTLEALRAIRDAGVEAQAAGELPAFLGSLEAVRVEILMAATQSAKQLPDEGDRLLSVRETAKRIGMSVWWVRKNKNALPIVRLPTGRFGFSAKGVERWLQRRSS